MEIVARKTSGHSRVFYSCRDFDLNNRSFFFREPVAYEEVVRLAFAEVGGVDRRNGSWVVPRRQYKVQSTQYQDYFIWDFYLMHVRTSVPGFFLCAPKNFIAGSFYIVPSTEYLVPRWLTGFFLQKSRMVEGDFLIEKLRPCRNFLLGGPASGNFSSSMANFFLQKLFSSC